jgi:hypothetical protein
MQPPIVPIFVGILFFSGIGVVSLFWPERIREYGLRHQSRFFPNPFAGWMRTRSYLISLRIIGALALAAAIAVALVAFRTD